MSEYWVSQAKYYCKICNCHIADNKPSRMHHDNGKKHKENLELFMKQKRQDRLHGARSESELKQQLAEIEKAAKEAIDADRVELGGSFFKGSSQQLSVPPPPPAPLPPPLPVGMLRSFAQRDKEQQLKQREGGAGDDDDGGVYTVGGHTYFEGKRHESQIHTGMPCQIFVEELDRWLDGTVATRIETPVPHTELTIASFDIAYKISYGIESSDSNTGCAMQTTATGESSNHNDSSNDGVGETNGQKVVTERGVKSDRLRLLADQDGKIDCGSSSEAGAGTVSSTGSAEEALASIRAQPAVIEENTGLGAWQTVSVRQVADDERLREQEESERAAEEMLAHGGQLGAVLGDSHKLRERAPRDRNHSEGAEEVVVDADSALAAYDPYNRHGAVYKGIQLTSVSEQEMRRRMMMESVAQGVTVQFKKRKIGTGVGAATKSSSSYQRAVSTEAANVVKTEGNHDGRNGSSDDRHLVPVMLDAAESKCDSEEGPLPASRIPIKQEKSDNGQILSSIGTGTVSSNAGATGSMVGFKIAGGGGGGRKKQFRKRTVED